MARFVALGRMTREGAVTLKDGVQRLAAVQEYFQKIGFRVVEIYATLGPYDYVAITEGPDDLASAFKSAAFVASFGSVSWTTLPAMPYQDFVKVVQDLPARGPSRA